MYFPYLKAKGYFQLKVVNCRKTAKYRNCTETAHGETLVPEQDQLAKFDYQIW